MTDNTWECMYCYKKQNEKGICANIAGHVCPKCFYSDNYYEEESYDY